MHDRVGGGNVWQQQCRLLIKLVTGVAGRLRPFLPLTNGMQYNYEIHARSLCCVSAVGHAVQL